MEDKSQFRRLSRLRDLTTDECKEAFASPIWVDDRLVYPNLGQVLERVYREEFRGLEQQTPQSFPGRFPHPEYVRCWEISNKVLAVWDELAATVEFVVLDWTDYVPITNTLHLLKNGDRRSLAVVQVVWDYITDEVFQHVGAWSFNKDTGKTEEPVWQMVEMEDLARELVQRCSDVADCVSPRDVASDSIVEEGSLGLSLRKLSDKCLESLLVPQEENAEWMDQWEKMITVPEWPQPLDNAAPPSQEEFFQAATIFLISGSYPLLSGMPLATNHWSDRVSSYYL